MDSLDAGNTGVGSTWRPNWGSVLSNWSAYSFVGAEQRFFSVAPVGAGEGFEDSVPTGGFGGSEFAVGAVGKHSVKGDA